MRITRKWKKGEMSRTIVVYCIRTMTLLLVWAVVMTTLASVFGWMVDISPVLTFAGAFFGGELTLLAFKRIFAKDDKEAEQNGLHQNY